MKESKKTERKAEWIAVVGATIGLDSCEKTCDAVRVARALDGPHGLRIGSSRSRAPPLLQCPFLDPTATTDGDA